MKVANINLMTKSYRKPQSPVDLPPFQVEEQASPNCISHITAPPGSQSTSEQTLEVEAMASNAEIKVAEMKWKALNVKVRMGNLAYKKVEKRRSSAVEEEQTDTAREILVCAQQIG